MRHPVFATLWFSLLPLACAPKAPESGSTSDIGATTLETSTSTGTSGEPTTGETTSGPPAPTVTGDPTEDEGLICLEGQPSLAPLWSRTLADPQPDEMLLVRSLGALDSGPLAIPGFTRTAANQSAPGVLWLGADGAPIAWTTGPLEATELDVIGVRVAGDQVVLLGPRGDGATFGGYVSRFAAGGPELSRAGLTTQQLNWPIDFELRGGRAVVIGTARPTAQLWLAEVDVATGAPTWEVPLPASNTPFRRAVAIGPGGEIVAGSAGWPGLDGPEYKLWRVDDDGALLWERDLLEPSKGGGELTDLLITPDGQVVAITTEFSPTPRIVMKAVTLADGAPTWTLAVATEDEAGVPVLQHGLVEPDALALVIARGPEFWDKGTADPLTAALHRVSFTGAVLDVTPLPLTDLELGPPWLAAARGACGDLVLFQANNQKSWLGSFAP